MKIDELTPEAIAIMKKLLNSPQALEDSSTLQLLFADRVVMGSLNEVHLTAAGGRLLAQVRSQTEQTLVGYRRPVLGLL